MSYMFFFIPDFVDFSSQPISGQVTPHFLNLIDDNLV